MKIKILQIAIILLLQNCGKQGQIQYPEGQKKPDFTRVFEE